MFDVPQGIQNQTDHQKDGEMATELLQAFMRILLTN